MHNVTAFPKEILFLRLSYLPAGRRTKCKTSKKRISFGKTVFLDTLLSTEEKTCEILLYILDYFDSINMTVLGREIWKLYKMKALIVSRGIESARNINAEL